MYIVTGDNGCRHVLVVGGRTWPTLVCFFVDYVHDKRIVLVNQLPSKHAYVGPTSAIVGIGAATSPSG